MTDLSQTPATETLTTSEDHDRVHAIPSYRRWYEGRHDWCWKWAQKQRAKASKMRASAEAKYRAELERIADWENEHSSDDAAYKAWSAADERRYWPLRRV
jgi:hypothetical protein